MVLPYSQVKHDSLEFLILTTDAGTIRIGLLPQISPATVQLIRQKALQESCDACTMCFDMRFNRTALYAYENNRDETLQRITRRTKNL